MGSVVEHHEEFGYGEERPIHNIDPQSFVRGILRAIGEDPNREGLRDTPKRVVRSWTELFSGYRQERSGEVGRLFTTFSESYDEMVIVRDVSFFSFCEHHMLPFFGRAHIGYLPNGRIVGLSKLARLVDIYARQLQVQERMGQQIGTAIMEHLQAKGSGVVLEAQHLCMTCRGVAKQNSITITSDMRGLFRDKPGVKEEFLRMVSR